MADHNPITTFFNSSLSRSILRSIDKAKSHVKVIGSTSATGVAYFLSEESICKNKELTHLVVLSSYTEALNLSRQLSFFRPDFRCHILPSFDQTPYSGLYPSTALAWQRLDFLFWASRAGESLASQVGSSLTSQSSQQPSSFDDKIDIFIVPASGLLQKTTPYQNFIHRTLELKVSEDYENLTINLEALGYVAAPLVEDKGQYAIRGGLIDVFSPAHENPVRIELFGDQIESLRLFNSQSQLTKETCNHYFITPCSEYFLSDDNLEKVISAFKAHTASAADRFEKEEAVRALTLKNKFTGIEYLTPYCFDQLASPLDYFSSDLQITLIDPVEIQRKQEEFFQSVTQEKKANTSSLFNYEVLDFYSAPEASLNLPSEALQIQFSSLTFLDEESLQEDRISFNTQSLFDLISTLQFKTAGSEDWNNFILKKFSTWKEDHYKIIIGSKNKTNTDRLIQLFKNLNFNTALINSDNYNWDDCLQGTDFIYLIARDIEESLLIHDDKIIFLRSADLLGKKQKSQATTNYEEFSKNAKRLNFGDLKTGDAVVHVKHGIGVYEGLKIMSIAGVDAEFIQIGYKDKDKLYLPVYRAGQLQKYSSSVTTTVLDKLGGTSWEKTKVKVKNHLKDIASELLKLYSQRSEVTRPALKINSTEFEQFENTFPFSETEDQLKTLNDINRDLSRNKPMDRLVCGDVGFGKTEIAMRAAFQAVQNGKQVAVLAPTTVLTFQHLETFKNRFKHFENIKIKSLNRFVSNADAKKLLAELKLGQLDIVIGTHRLFSKDVQFKDLGLLIIDEEQKFGVTHKEKIKRLKVNIDTLTLSATPIPRTLNMSFSGIRDLSIINTPPMDRLPTRTFVSKFDPELIRKAISAEIARGGQVYFIHNRIQSIYGVAQDIQKILPEARIKVAHGQMDEAELESTMLAFFNHEIDILICTAIVESGMDVPRANTMFIDQAHMFGLSQLYQLRGRVGRSKARAYCYLLLPKDRKVEKDALERLKIIQENSALGSGIRIAQYDLELRGAGNILGDDQSGHVNSVGYELYMDLLNEAIADAKGEPLTDKDLDPEINLKIPALIPDSYIPDIRLRLGYYKALADIQSQNDLDEIENELKDQFGELPEPVVNLMGLMLIRKQCKDLGVRDISAGLKNISLVFTEKTKLKPEKAIELSMRANKKYSLTPDQRLNIRLNNITWAGVYEELQYLISLI